MLLPCFQVDKVFARADDGQAQRDDRGRRRVGIDRKAGFFVISQLSSLDRNCLKKKTLACVRDSIDRCIGTRYTLSMIRSFHHRGLKRLYERGNPSGIAADQLDRIALALADLDSASKLSDIDLPGYRLHPLRGDRQGLWSISISGNWRITFRFEAGDVYDVALVDYH